MIDVLGFAGSLGSGSFDRMLLAAASEDNQGLPGVTRNAIDWASRPGPGADGRPGSPTRPDRPPDGRVPLPAAPRRIALR